MRRITEIVTSNFPPFRDQTMAIKEVETSGKQDSEKLGEVQFFLGPNGSGKSRLLAALAGMGGNRVPLKSRMGEPAMRNWNVQALLNKGLPCSIRFPENSSDVVTEGKFDTAFAYAGGCYLKNAIISPNTSVVAASQEERLSFLRPSTYSDRLAQAVYNLKMEAAQDFMNRGGGALAPEKLPRYERIVHSLETRLSKALRISSEQECQFAFRATTRPSPMLAVEWNGRTLQFDQLPDGLRMVIGSNLSRSSLVLRR